MRALSSPSYHRHYTFVSFYVSCSFSYLNIGSFIFHSVYTQSVVVKENLKFKFLSHPVDLCTVQTWNISANTGNECAQNAARNQQRYIFVMNRPQIFIARSGWLNVLKWKSSCDAAENSIKKWLGFLVVQGKANKRFFACVCGHLTQS